MRNMEGKEEEAKRYYDEAHEDYDRAIELEPEEAKFYHSKGLAFEGTHDEEDYYAAIENYKKALELKDDFFGARVHLGNMYHNSNEFTKALKCYSTFIAQNSKHQNVYVSRGRVYQDMRNHQFAINDFDMAISLDKGYSDAYYHRGVSKLKIRSYGEAEQDLQTALETQDKENYAIYDALGC